MDMNILAHISRSALIAAALFGFSLGAHAQIDAPEPFPEGFDPFAPIPDIAPKIPNTEKPDCEDGFEVIIIPKGNGEPIYKCEKFKNLFEKDAQTELAPQDEDESSELSVEGADNQSDNQSDSQSAAITEAPDYSQLSKSAENEARLTDLFARLKDEEVPEDANLIAEEIWALWLDSGSASINLVLRRGSDAQAKKQIKKARRMYDHVTALSPDYAEGWARSARLALEENDFSRALNEAARTLTLEPRHFYALWTLGNAFEQLGRLDEALEAYREANALYPELAPVKEQLGRLESQVEGDVL